MPMILWSSTFPGVEDVRAHRGLSGIGIRRVDCSENLLVLVESELELAGEAFKSGK
jgi:hypothetical protein